MLPKRLSFFITFFFLFVWFFVVSPTFAQGDYSCNFKEWGVYDCAGSPYSDTTYCSASDQSRACTNWPALGESDRFVCTYCPAGCNADTYLCNPIPTNTPVPPTPTPTSTPTPIPPTSTPVPCSCGGWVTQGCNEYPCTSGQGYPSYGYRRYTRTCTPSGCLAEVECRNECVPTPTPTNTPIPTPTPTPIPPTPTPTTIPLCPANLRENAKGLNPAPDGSCWIQIAWNDVSGEESYKTYRNASYQTTLGAGAILWKDDPAGALLTPGSTYEYYVNPIYRGAEKDCSAQKIAIICPSPPTPTPTITNTPTPVPTSTPIPTNTPGPTSTPTNTPIPTATPTQVCNVAAPSGYTATRASPTNVDLLFIDNATDETSFNIERRTGLTCASLGSWAAWTSRGANAGIGSVESPDDTDAPDTQCYQWQVRSTRDTPPGCVSNWTQSNSIPPVVSPTSTPTPTPTVLPPTPTPTPTTGPAPTPTPTTPGPTSTPIPTPTPGCPSCPGSVLLTDVDRGDGTYNKNLTWNNVANEEGYQVYRCTGATCSIPPDGSLQTTLGVDITTWTDTNGGVGFGPGTWVYEVRPFKAGCTALNCADYPNVIVPPSGTPTPTWAGGPSEAQCADVILTNLDGSPASGFLPGGSYKVISSVVEQGISSTCAFSSGKWVTSSSESTLNVKNETLGSWVVLAGSYSVPPSWSQIVDFTPTVSGRLDKIELYLQGGGAAYVALQKTDNSFLAENRVFAPASAGWAGAKFDGISFGGGTIDLNQGTTYRINLRKDVPRGSNPQWSRETYRIYIRTGWSVADHGTISNQSCNSDGSGTAEFAVPNNALSGDRFMVSAAVRRTSDLGNLSMYGYSTNSGYPASPFACFQLVTISSGPWFQTQEGDVHAQGTIMANIPATASEKFFSLQGTGGYPGVVSHQDTASFGAGSVSSKGWLAKTILSGKAYSYFYALAGSPTTPNFDGTMPLTTGIYYANNTVQIKGSWNVPSGRKIVVFVAKDPGNANTIIQTNIDVALGGSLAIITEGHINIENAVSSIEGFFSADEHISTGTGNIAFTGEGVFLTPSFVLGRDLGTNPNKFNPAEKFLYRPDFMLNAHSSLWQAPHTWEELAP